MKPFLILMLLASLSFAESLPQTAYFVPNQGQWDGAFEYYCDFGLMQCYVTMSGLTLDLQEPASASDLRRGGSKTRPSDMDLPPFYGRSQEGSALRKGHVLILNYVNANPHPEIIAEDLLPHYSNYFLSKDSCRWRGHVPHYSRVIQKNVWPGIEIELKASEHGIESVYHIKPGADPSQIVLDHEGLDEQLIVDANGRLHLKTSVGDLTEQSPFAYQIQNRLQSAVPVQFRLVDENRYGFTLGSYDPSQEVVIDPLIYCTRFPRTIQHMVADQDSNKVFCGTIWGGASFPTTPGSYEDTIRSWAFICKLNSNCNNFLFSTYFPGGSGYNGTLKSHFSNNIVYLSEAGVWPLTFDAFDSTLEDGKLGIAFLSSDGSTLLFGSYLGGSGRENYPHIDFDSLGYLYILGTTSSSDFPITPDAMYPAIMSQGHSMFLTKVDLSPPRRILYSTYFAGGSGDEVSGGLQVVQSGRAWIVANYCHDTDLPTTANGLIPVFPPEQWSVSYFALVDFEQDTVLYGSYAGGTGMAIDGIIPTDSNRLWIFGLSEGTELPYMPQDGYDPGPPDVVDGFIVHMELPNHVLAGTYFGGSWYDGIYKMCIEPSGSVLVTGETYSADLPVTPDAFDPHHHGGQGEPGDSSDVFLARFSPDLDSLLYSTYIGGTYPDWPNDMIYESPDRIWIAGNGGSNDFPFTPDAFWTGNGGSFILRFSLPPWSDAQNRLTLSPSSFSLSCYPNPFNPSTRIEFTLPKAGKVSLKVYDVLGREVAVLVDETLNARDHDVVFDGSDLSSGIYFARLEAAGLSQTRKMVLLK